MGGKSEMAELIRIRDSYGNVVSPRGRFSLAGYLALWTAGVAVLCSAILVVATGEPTTGLASLGVVGSIGVPLVGGTGLFEWAVRKGTVVRRDLKATLALLDEAGRTAEFEPALRRAVEDLERAAGKGVSSEVVSARAEALLRQTAELRRALRAGPASAPAFDLSALAGMIDKVREHQRAEAEIEATASPVRGRPRETQ